MEKKEREERLLLEPNNNNHMNFCIAKTASPISNIVIPILGTRLPLLLYPRVPLIDERNELKEANRVGT
jgi:hypothetical protein